ncbi:MAG: hypothetical protein ACYS0F_02605 [Planctomycetota bacterium]|jgi:hypothetical protein
MRVFSNLLFVVSVAGLALSIWLAPQKRAEAARSTERGLVISDPLERGRLGREQKALGLSRSGFEAALATDPTNAEAINGLMESGVRLGAVTIGRPGVGETIAQALSPYLENYATSDPAGDALEAALQEYVQLRLTNKWYLVRGATGMFLAGRGEEIGFTELRSLMSQGPFWREYFPAVLRHTPAWVGVEPIVRTYLEGNDPASRALAGITLMTYRRFYGVGEDLCSKHRRAIGESILRTKSSMLPDPNDSTPDHVGGLTLLALALYDTPTTDRIVERMRAVEHPYLPRVVALAKLWAGFGDFTKVDFDNPRYSSWTSMEREYYYRGALLRYAEYVGAGEREKATALLEGPIADALVAATDSVRVNARRMLAAVHPDRSEFFHREMYEAGGVQRVFGAFGVPNADLVGSLLPALTSPDPAISTLASVGLLRGDKPSPIQMPTPKE